MINAIGSRSLVDSQDQFLVAVHFVWFSVQKLEFAAVDDHTFLGYHVPCFLQEKHS